MVKMIEFDGQGPINMYPATLFHHHVPSHFSIIMYPATLFHHHVPSHPLPSSCTQPPSSIIMYPATLFHHVPSHPLPSSCTQPPSSIIMYPATLFHQHVPIHPLPSSCTQPPSSIIMYPATLFHHHVPSHPLPSTCTQPLDHPSHSHVDCYQFMTSVRSECLLKLQVVQCMFYYLGHVSDNLGKQWEFLIMMSWRRLLSCTLSLFVTLIHESE